MDASLTLAAEYSAKAAAYARHWSPMIRPMALPLLPALPLRTAGRVLDVGAGTGALLADLEDAAPDARVIGVDRSEGMLRVARRSGHQRRAVTDAQRLGIRRAGAAPDPRDPSVKQYASMDTPDKLQEID